MTQTIYKKRATEKNEIIESETKKNIIQKRNEWIRIIRVTCEYNFHTIYLFIFALYFTVSISIKIMFQAVLNLERVQWQKTYIEWKIVWKKKDIIRKIATKERMLRRKKKRFKESWGWVDGITRRKRKVHNVQMDENRLTRRKKWKWKIYKKKWLVSLKKKNKKSEE